MFEEWVTILEFPAYKISNFGNVMNQETQRPVACSLTKQGVVKVALTNPVGRFTRSVAVLVAHIFVHGYNDIFNTLIHLDGDLKNCEASNLMWRPRWFAYQYHRQFTHHYVACVEIMGQAGPVFEINCNTVYNNVLDAAMFNGLLIRELTFKIWEQNLETKAVWPTGQIFSFMD